MRRKAQPKPTGRYVLTFEKTLRVVQKPYVQMNHFKPEGFWYGVGDGWLRWVKARHRRMHNYYLYKIDVDMSKLLVLDTAEKIREFTDRFANRDLPGGLHIEWGRVERTTSSLGIEIAPYQPSLRFDLEVGWYYPWDVASGCIWDVSAIRRVARVTNWR